MKTLVKYGAILLALLLAGSVVAGCVTTGVTIVKALAKEDFDFGEDIFKIIEEGISMFGKNENVKSGVFEVTEPVLVIKADGVDGKFIIQTGEKFEVTYENIPEAYEFLIKDGELICRNESRKVFGFHIGENNAVLSITVPEGVLLKEITVDHGAGELELLDLTTEELRIDGGSGSIKVQNIEAERSRLDTGSGILKVMDCRLGETRLNTGSGICTFEEVIAENLLLDSGSGRVTYHGVLTGNCIFDTGSGSLNLNIEGKEEDYNIRADLGSGGMYINGKKESERKITYEDAANSFVIESGSGRVSINFTE